MTRLRRIAPLLLAALALATVLRADASLAHARAAQALLDPAEWSRVLRIENSRSRARYPRALHALVFAHDGVLWFYYAGEGTQSLSLHRDDLAAETADLAPLLRAIDPGFARFEIIPAPAAPAPATGAPPPNACFIECLAELRARLARGEPVREARLLTSWTTVAPSRGPAGHTRLACAMPHGVVVFDPGRPATDAPLGAVFPVDPLRAANLVAAGGPPPLRASWFQLRDPAARGSSGGGEIMTLND